MTEICFLSTTSPTITIGEMLDHVSSESEDCIYCIGDAALSEVVRRNHETIAKEFGGESVGTMIFPVGWQGELVWGRLPISLACRANFPGQTSVVAVEPFLLTDRDQLYWDWLNGQGESLMIGETLEDEQQAPVTYPALVPKRPSLSQSELDSLARLGVEGVPEGGELNALRAGLLQVHNDLQRSHEFAQQCDGRNTNNAGDYWHGIMHRREPDYGNAKYWFRGVGDHPIHEELASETRSRFAESGQPQSDKWTAKLTDSGWNAAAFVDFCETAATNSDLKPMAEELQWIEMMLLLEQTYIDAIEAN